MLSYTGLRGTEASFLQCTDIHRMGLGGCRAPKSQGNLVCLGHSPLAYARVTSTKNRQLQNVPRLAVEIRNLTAPRLCNLPHTKRSFHYDKLEWYLRSSLPGICKTYCSSKRYKPNTEINVMVEKVVSYSECSRLEHLQLPIQTIRPSPEMFLVDPGGTARELLGMTEPWVRHEETSSNIPRLHNERSFDWS